MKVCEITLEDLRDDYDWCEVFADEDALGGNTLTVAATLETVVRSGLTKEQAGRLGLEHPGDNEDTP